MSVLKKTWNFVWKSDSWASWLVNVVLAVVIVKFLIYPGLGLMLKTDYPVVAVVSCSMEHRLSNCGDGSKVKDLCGSIEVKEDNYWNYCGGWYENKNISEGMFEKFPFKNGFNKGDIMVLYGYDINEIKIGDVIVFDSGLNTAPIIHRVVNKDENVFMTKGDHNVDQSYFEKNINKEKVYGKAILRIPYLGWIKVMFNELLGGVLG